MKYFLHDTNSFDDEKITELFMNFGYEGLGLFYTLLEKIAGQEKPIKTEVLKSQLKVGKRLNKCWLFMEQIDIIQSKNGETFNEQLLNFSEKYQIKKEKNRERVSEWRDKQKDTKNVTSTKPVRNRPKVKESKVNIEFSEFWNLYNKKVGDKNKCKDKWMRLKDEEREQIMQTIPKWLEQIKDKQFQPHPQTYLNQERWNDEIIDIRMESSFNKPKNSENVERILNVDYDNPKFKSNRK